MIDTPALYLSAEASSGDGKACNNGIELRAGIKNKIHVAALDMWDYVLRDDILYEKGITCLTYVFTPEHLSIYCDIRWDKSYVLLINDSVDGFSSSNVEPDKSVFGHVTAQRGGDIFEKAPGLENVELAAPGTDNGEFRLVTDYDETSIVVSGKDGNVYLVTKTSDYDLSAPWGSVNSTSGVLSVDVFGRVLSFKRYAFPSNFIALNVFDPKAMPTADRVA